jgi:hypothetical protein
MTQVIKLLKIVWKFLNTEFAHNTINNYDDGREGVSGY